MDGPKRYEPLSYGVVLVLAYFSLAMLTPRGGFAGDIDYWVTWTKTISANGLGKAYESGINYHPLFLYVLAIFGLLRNGGEAIRAHIHELKYFVLLFDFLAIYLLIRFVVANKRSALPAFFILLNPAYLYNTIIWGQVDSIHVFFSFASLLAAMQGRTATSAVLFLLAFNMKAQAIVFAPFLALFLLPQFFGLRKFLKSFFLGAGVQALLLLPFILEDRMKGLLRVVLHAVDYNPVVSMNAFNAWFLLLRGHLSSLPDADVFMGISYKVWGLMTFSAVSLALLLAVGLRIYVRVRHKEPYQMGDYQLFFLCLGLVSIAFFYFNTQMHERYAHPAILFLGVYSVLSGRYVIFILASLGYLLNLDAVLGFLKLPIKDPTTVSLLYLAGFVIGAYEVFMLTVPRFAYALARQRRAFTVALICFLCLAPGSKAIVAYKDLTVLVHSMDSLPTSDGPVYTYRLNRWEKMLLSRNVSVKCVTAMKDLKGRALVTKSEELERIRDKNPDGSFFIEHGGVRCRFIHIRTSGAFSLLRVE